MIQCHLKVLKKFLCFGCDVSSLLNPGIFDFGILLILIIIKSREKALCEKTISVTKRHILCSITK